MQLEEIKKALEVFMLSKYFLRVYLSLLLLFITTVGFAQDANEFVPVHTSDGLYYASIEYRGQNNGQNFYNQRANQNAFFQMMGAAPNTNIKKLTKGQWECINKMLARYETSKGDTYEVIFGTSIYPWETYGSCYYFICEFTSSTQYKYWILRLDFFKSGGSNFL